MKIVDKKQDIFTIPNALSLFRLILAAGILWVFYEPGIENRRYVLALLLIISAITDFFDGKIARRFHMVSELGKILDPVADKVTQGVLLICLLSKYKMLRGIFLLFLLKETFMVVGGMKVLSKTNRNEGAMWYGKANTAIFYAVMFLLVFVPDIPNETANMLILLCGASMLLSFVMYAQKYRRIIGNHATQNKEGALLKLWNICMTRKDIRKLAHPCQKVFCL